MTSGVALAGDLGNAQALQVEKRCLPAAARVVRLLRCRFLGQLPNELYEGPNLIYI
ncbi:hypothetical protein [Mycetohabitans sp. B46]|uniref:hypothetical protein n=1 Tax=Mycetohabitans sp. B46 TaxID=2772536 RepID=UPI00307D2722